MAESMRDKIDLNAPAFGAGAQTFESLKDTTPEDSSVEEAPQDIKEEVADDVDSVEENKVPYSRFKNIHNRALEAEAEVEKWKQRAEEIEQSRSTETVSDDDIPEYFRKLYAAPDGSNWNIVKEAWAVQQQHDEEVTRRAYEAGQRGAQELEYKQRERINSNVATLDENFEDLSAFVGRNLSAKEQSAILDIVDDYTAKDEEGNYQGAIMPFDKAWEIYELKQNSAKVSQRKDRDVVASLSGTSTQGDTSINEEQNKNWNPLARGTWRSRL